MSSPDKNVIARRRIAEPDNHRWWSIEERELGGARALFFVDDTTFIKIKNYPANWLDLPDGRLLALRERPMRPAEPARRRRRVLIVDDDASARQTARRSLRSLTDEIFEAESAMSGVEMARLLKPDLILLDYVLPGLTGAEAVRLLRSDPQLRDIPILLYAAQVDRVDRDASAHVEAVLEKHELTCDRGLELVMSVLEQR